MYLLDTHILLWLFFEPEKLSNSESLLFTDNENSFCYSAISLWEISIKFSLNKFKFEKFTPEMVSLICKKSGIEYLNLEEDTVASSYLLAKFDNHKDPFDRLLIWQCIKNDLILISRDRKFEAYQAFGLKIFK